MNKELKNIALTFLSALLSALTLHTLVAPAGFAPSGVDGIATMLQHVTGINIGWFTLIINIPLLIIAWFILKRRYVIYTVLFTVLSSVMLIFLQSVQFYQFNLPEEKLLVALISGGLLGVRTAIMLKMEASTGGVDIVAGFIQKANSYINIERIISIICCVTSLFSVFVYRNALSVLLAFVQMFVFDRAAEYVQKDIRHAVEFKIITKTPRMLTDKIINELQHGATTVESCGAFSDENSYIVMTVVNIRQIPQLLNIVSEDKSAFVYYTEAKGVNGNFRWRKEDEVK